MNTRYWALYVKILLLAFVALIYGPESSGQGKFIENMGQWDPNIASRAEISGGAIYLCKNQLRYNFIDMRDYRLLHADPYHTDTCSVHGQAFFMDWLNANANPEISSANEYPEYYNYFIGNDPSQWKSGVHAFSDVSYTNLYNGINLAINAEGPDLEYTYTVMPGTDPSSIKIKVEGAQNVYVKDNDLHIDSRMVQIIEKSPYAYQMIEGFKVAVPCGFILIDGNIETFVFPKGYNKNQPLIIDPVVIFASYSGSKADNFGFTGTYDTLGYGYSGGDVYGAGYPTTPGAYMQAFQGGQDYSLNPGDPGYIEIQVLGFSPRDVAILKYTPDGKGLVYATYLGGKKGNEQPHSMVVDKSGDLIVFGTTASSDFPVTSTAFKSSLGGKTDLFISRFSADGKRLLASTFMGGTGFDGLNGVNSWHDSKGYVVLDAGTPICYNYGDQFRGEIISDNNDNIYIATCTMSTDFPVTSGCFQPKFGGGKQDGCVFKMDSNLHKLIWSSFLGGTKDDGAYSLDINNKNEIVVCGGTLSPYFFKHDSTYQDTLKGSSDAYVCRIKSDGSKILKATYLGTPSYEQAYFVRLDNSNNVYLYGQTESKTFPVFNVKYSNPKSGNFITKFDDSLKTIIYSSVFGSGKGAPDISPTAFLIDKCEKVYISGWGGLLDIYHPTLNKLGLVFGMPITRDAFQKVTLDSADFYAAVFEKNMDTLLYSSYFGGKFSGEHVDGGTSRFDKNGIMYQSVCGGCEGNSDFPTTPGAWSRANGCSNGCNNLLFKVDLKISTLKAAFITPIYSCLNVTLKISNASFGAQTYLWDFGDGSPTSTDSIPNHSYSVPGTYKVTLIVTNLNSCQQRDTVLQSITVYKHSKAAFNVQKTKCSTAIKFIQTGESNTTRWYFGDGSQSDSLNGFHTYRKPGIFQVKLLVDSGTSCVDSMIQTVNVTGIHADFSDSLATCQPSAVYFKNLSAGADLTYMWQLPLASYDTSKNTFINVGNMTGTYPVTLVVMDSTGCKDSVTKSITFYKSPTAAFTDSLFPCSSKVLVQNKSTGINSFKLFFSDGATSTSDSIVHLFPRDSIVSIKMITDSGSSCSDTLVKTVSINYPKAGYKFAIDTCTGEVVFINTSLGTNASFWKFDPKDSSTFTNPTFTYITKGKYPVKLVAASSSGCIDSITQVISIENSRQVLYIPNIFTPNGDAYNNTFDVIGLNPCNEYDFAIYNRWGQEFYHSKGNSFSWNGFYNGIKVPEGVYYYVLIGKDTGQKTGAITVVY